MRGLKPFIGIPLAQKDYGKTNVAPTLRWKTELKPTDHLYEVTQLLSY